MSNILKYPATAKIYLKNGKPYNVVYLLKNPYLSETMEKIVKDG